MRGSIALVGMALSLTVFNVDARATATCQVLSDPTGDVQLVNGGPFVDPTRDLTGMAVQLTARTLVLRTKISDIQAVPFGAPGDILGIQFVLGKQVLVESSRRLHATSTPGNTEYTKVLNSDAVKATSSWDAATDIVTIAIDRPSLAKYLGRDLAVGSLLSNTYALIAPAVTDQGTPVYFDAMGNNGGGQGTPVRIPKC